MTPVEERFNRDGGLEVPGCWTAVMRRQGGRSNLHQRLLPYRLIILRTSVKEVITNAHQSCSKELSCSSKQADDSLTDVLHEGGQYVVAVRLIVVVR